MNLSETEKLLCTSFRTFDLSDIMRLQMLAWEIDRTEHTVESLKKTSQFLCAFSNFNLTDEFLQQVLDKRKESMQFEINQVENNLNGDSPLNC